MQRAVDVALAGGALVLASPVLGVAAAVVKLGDGGPVLFRQTRVGKDGVDFELLKLRTMVVGAETMGAGLAVDRGDPRITRSGRLLRKLSLDELPQLWNVFKGEMSLVGPRPLPMDESAGCDQWQRTRLDVTPGLTCIWQVKGRSRVTFDEWMRMDVNYIRRRNFLHDFKILTQTIPAVLLRRGAR